MHDGASESQQVDKVVWWCLVLHLLVKVVILVLVLLVITALPDLLLAGGPDHLGALVHHLILLVLAHHLTHSRSKDSFLLKSLVLVSFCESSLNVGLPLKPRVAKI